MTLFTALCQFFLFSFYMCHRIVARPILIRSVWQVEIEKRPSTMSFLEEIKWDSHSWKASRIYFTTYLSTGFQYPSTSRCLLQEIPIEMSMRCKVTISHWDTHQQRTNAHTFKLTSSENSDMWRHNWTTVLLLPLLQATALKQLWRE